MIGQIVQVHSLREKALWLLVVMCALVLDESSFFDYRFNFTTLLVFYIGVQWPISRAFLWAFMIGLVLDSLSLRLIGPHILSKVIVVFLTYFFKTGIFNLASLLSAILCFVFTIIDGIVVYISLSLFDVRPTPPAAAINLITFQAVVNSIMAYYLFEKNEQQPHK
ncbi:MAG: rod shape-determining protein MreD [Nitrospirae bacterium]|nr:rod shape-determining protein MreD [Nitrospirota bacterium]